MVAKVQRLELPLLTQERDEDTASPLESLTAPLPTHTSHRNAGRLQFPLQQFSTIELHLLLFFIPESQRPTE